MQVYYVYHLTAASGQVRTVCKEFYLATLGFSKTSGVVSTAKANATSVQAQKDQRGGNRVDFTEMHQHVDRHIKSYNPCISHYRREHAPNRLYLPHELSVREMHSDFLAKHEDQKINYSTYLRRVQSMNISFAKLGDEQCELCEELKLTPHDLEEGICKEDCGVCARKSAHMARAYEASNIYHQDGSEVVDGRVVRSVDLQKVIMLPRLPGFKSACFTRRLVVFHHTYAPIGKYTSTIKTTSIVWDESTAGRKCEDIASAFEKAIITKDRDQAEIVLFMDNCAAQNKNYALFTTLLSLVNSEKISAQKITLKYLESGHTFMSADSCHAAVEREMKRQVNVYDMADFCQCVEQAGAKVIQPTFEDFRHHQGQQSAAKLRNPTRPMLADIRQAEFRRGERVVYYKLRHTDDAWIEFDYLKAKHNMNTIPTSIAKPRGVPSAKKNDIIKNLCKFMPPSRQNFWNNLTTDDGVVDLIDNDE